MTLDFGAWLGRGANSSSSKVALRAQIEEAHIRDKPIELVLTRYEVDMAPQLARIEWDNAALNANSELGSATMRRGYVYGVKGHPTLPDLDIEEWDTFRYEKDEYTVVSVNHHIIGHIQALFEAV